MYKRIMYMTLVITNITSCIQVSSKKNTVKMMSKESLEGREKFCKFKKKTAN